MARAYVIYPSTVTHEQTCKPPTRGDSKGLFKGSYSECQSCPNVWLLDGWMFGEPIWVKVKTFEQKKAWKKFKDARR